MDDMIMDLDDLVIDLDIDTDETEEEVVEDLDDLDDELVLDLDEELDMDLNEELTVELDKLEDSVNESEEGTLEDVLDMELIDEHTEPPQPETITEERVPGKVSKTTKVETMLKHEELDSIELDFGEMDKPSVSDKQSKDKPKKSLSSSKSSKNTTKETNKPKDEQEISLSKHVLATEIPTSVRFIPDFDISEKNLDIDTYQVRKTQRTKEEINDLKNRIELQGQVEPIQIHVKDGKNYLIAGAGRVIALRMLDRPAKALVYTNLTEEEALKISYGTNEARVVMSEWDKVHSIGSYYDKNPDISKSDIDDNNSLVNIFGLNKSSIYNYLKLWDFYKDKEEFHTFFETFRCPLYVMVGIVDIVKEHEDKINSYSKIIEFLTVIVNRKDINKSMFNSIFASEMAAFLLKLAEGVNISNIQNLPFDDKELSQAELDTEKALAKVVEGANKEELASKLDASEVILANIAEIEQLIDTMKLRAEEIASIKDYRSLIPTIIHKRFTNKVNQISTMMVKIL